MQRNRYVTVFYILLICFSLQVFSAFSSGAQEDSVIKAEELIDRKEYNAAMLILTEMLRTNPKKINEVQELLSRIRTEKELYNDKYEELIEVYGGDDVEAAYPLISELEELDPNPNEATRASLVLARETAGFVFNNNRWVEIMEDAALQLADEDYPAAIETYMTGFDLSRLIFRDSGYGNIVVNDVFSRADSMNEESQEFLGIYPEILQQSSNLGSSFAERNLDDYSSAVEDILPNLQRAAEIRESLKDTADYFIVQENNIRTTAGDDKQIHYLIYMDRLLNGRTTVEEREGITGAIELFWNEVFSGITADAAEYTGEIFTRGESEFASGDLNAAEDSFSDLLRIAASSIEIYDFGENYFNSDSQYERNGLLSADPDLYNSWKTYIEQASNVAEEFPVIISKQRTLVNFENRIAAIDSESDNFREIGNQIKEDISIESSEISALLSEWESTLSRIRSERANDSGELTDKILAAVTIPVYSYGKLADEMLTTEISLASTLSAIDLARAEQEFEIVKSDVDASSELIQGVADEKDAAAAEVTGFEVVYKYPDQALDQLLNTEQSVKDLISEIDLLDERIVNERAEIRLSPELRALSVLSADLMEKAQGLLVQAVSLADKAREQIFTAEKLKQEGERRIEESRLLTQRAQFAAAKERLEQAANKFDESLSYLEDQVLRTYRDNEIPRLYEEIQVAENNLVVRQVREYLTSGKSNYSQGNFPAAQSVLIKAQSRWSDTNVEPNPEVEYWLTLTQTALSVTSGRVIAVTDPLYAEMNQYLNQARADFQSAKKEYDLGRRTSADTFFMKAEQSLLYVQQFFPFNEAARVLNLRISQYRDPDQFAEIFGNDFRTARNLISTNPQKAYIDLKDLATINPSYPGLQSAITEAEYAAGIKVRPPDREKLERSAELYDLAFNIVSRNIRSEFSVALSYLNEAISLNPNNNEAIRLKDRISTDVGGTATAVMSNTDQQLYNEAVSEFTAGNYLKARIIVENLLKDADNQRNPKLLDLQERIERTR